MEKNLNLFLANLVVEYHKLQNFHWYVKGKNFFPLHAKLEELYNGINKMIDENAENILIIGGKPVGSLKNFLALSEIKEEEEKYLSEEYILKEVITDFNYLLDKVKKIKKEADELSEYIISASMDDYIKYFSKILWMLNQSMDN